MSDQKGLTRGILDVFCSRPMVRFVTAFLGFEPARDERESVRRISARANNVAFPILQQGRTTKSSTPWSLPAAGFSRQVGFANTSEVA